MDRGLRVMVAVPTHETHPALFTYDLAQLMAFTSANFMGPGAPLDSINLSFMTGTYVHMARQELAEVAVEQGADFVLWLDSDMRFPKDTLVRLLKHNEDMVGINYSKRGVPPDYVAIKRIHPAEKCVTTPDSTGLEEVEAIGFGALLLRTKVLTDLPTKEEEGPWFFYEWDEDLGQMVGEDVYFARKVRDAGYRVLVDHDLSKDCAHIGTLEYRIEHAMDAVGV